MFDATSLINLGVPAVVAEKVGWTYESQDTAGSSQTDATACTNKLVLMDGAGGSTDGVCAPPLGVGEVALIKNHDNATTYVYPSSASGTFNGGSAAAGVQVAAYAGVLLIGITATDTIALEIPAA